MRNGLLDCIHAFQFLPKCSVLRTLYYNFKLLPFRQAHKFPIAVGKNTIIKNTGDIIFDCSISPFMVILGVSTIPAFEDYSSKTQITNAGTIIIRNKINIHPGAKIWVEKGAELLFDGYNIIGAETKVACHKNIKIGKYSGCAWNCEIFDTDFHYTKDIVSGRIFDKNKEIVIGADVFIGNHVNIGKGTKLPDGSVVAAWSNVSGSFMKKSSAPFISGPKADMIDSGYYIPHGYKMNIDVRYAKMFAEKKNRKNSK